jgi:transposase
MVYDDGTSTTAELDIVGTDLLRNGAPVSRPVGISRMPGHGRLETTIIYARVAGRDLTRQPCELSPRRSKNARPGR